MKWAPLMCKGHSCRQRTMICLGWQNSRPRQSRTGAKEEVSCKVPRGSSKCFVQTEDGKMGRECHNKQHSYWQVNKEQIWLASHKDSDVYLTVFTLRQRYNSSPGDEISLAFPPRRATRGTFASLLCSLHDCRCQLIPLWVFLPTRTMIKPLSRW